MSGATINCGDVAMAEHALAAIMGRTSNRCISA